MVANAQDRYIGPDFGVFYPTSSTLRQALGDSWFSFGASSLRTGELSPKSLGTNWNTVSQSRGGNKIFMASYTVGTFQPFGGNQDSIRPFVALRGGASYIDYAIGPANNRISSKRLGYNFNAEAGVFLNERLTLSARYDVYSRHSGLNFDGLSLSLRYGLIKF